MEKLKEALDWDRFSEPKRTMIYRLLNAASWIASSEMGEATHSMSAFLTDFCTVYPEWADDLNAAINRS